MPAEPTPDRRTVLITRATNLAAAVSPDGTIVVDALARLWLVPAGGGTARPVTGALSEATLPDWSPDGGTIAFQSYASGGYHLWTVRPDGSGARQLTGGPFDHREPVFAPDGRRIAFSSDRGDGYGIHVLDLATSSVTTWADGPDEEFMPAWSPDGTRIAFVTGDSAIDVVDERGVRERAVDVADATIASPFWTPDGHDLGYTLFVDRLPKRLGSTARETVLVVAGSRVSDAGEDVFGFRAAWPAPDTLLYTVDGGLRCRTPASGAVHDVPFEIRTSVPRRPPRPARRPPDGPHPVRGVVAPALSPDGGSVAFCALGDLWTMRIGGRPERLTDGGAHVADPSWSPDGTQLACSTDRAGVPDVWTLEPGTGRERRLTAGAGAAVAPVWSPDGTMIAFRDQDGATLVVTPDGEVDLLLDPLWQPGRVSWSPDSSRLAMAVNRPYSARFREGTNQILVLDLGSREVTHHAPAPHRSLTSRGYDGPVWSPDGAHLAFVMGGLLHLLPVDPTGRPTGDARAVVDEMADAPSWSADSTRLLYLSGGGLRLAELDGGAVRSVRSVPVPLTWSPARTSGPRTVHAGRLWDGVTPSLRHDVDVVLDGDRIAEVTEHRPDRPGPWLDASRRTVLPGLVDMHVHDQMKARELGSRQGRIWLAFGITAVRSAGDPAHPALQEHEASQAGTRLGPRYFGSGEPVDGSRVHYGFMRPTTTPAELHREVERATVLGHHLLKAYVRLPVSGQQALAAAGRAGGAWVTSHYLYPAVEVGLDGVEHLGASSRSGYSQTVSRLGRTYSDVVEILAGSGMSLTPTLFASAALLATGGDEWLADPRVVTLFPPWERELLERTVELVSDPQVIGTLRRTLASNVDAVRRLHDAGGVVLAGTDAPIDHIAISLHLNLRALVDGGMRPYDALRTATASAARALGAADDLGSVEPGRWADLVVVDGDPLTDVAAAAAVRTVVLGGVPIDTDELLAGNRS